LDVYTSQSASNLFSWVMTLAFEGHLLYEQGLEFVAIRGSTNQLPKME
jgi:hypothetical protein